MQEFYVFRFRVSGLMVVLGLTVFGFMVLGFTVSVYRFMCSTYGFRVCLMCFRLMVLGLMVLGLSSVWLQG